MHERFKNVDLIIHLKEATITSMDAFNFFICKTSVVKAVFCSGQLQLNQDDFEDDFSVVPTLQEAHDYIEMELIQRDLGF